MLIRRGVLTRVGVVVARRRCNIMRATGKSRRPKKLPVRCAKNSQKLRAVSKRIRSEINASEILQRLSQSSYWPEPATVYSNRAKYCPSFSGRVGVSKTRSLRESVSEDKKASDFGAISSLKCTIPSGPGAPLRPMYSKQSKMS